MRVWRFLAGASSALFCLGALGPWSSGVLTNGLPATSLALRTGWGALSYGLPLALAGGASVMAMPRTQGRFAQGAQASLWIGIGVLVTFLWFLGEPGGNLAASAYAPAAPAWGLQVAVLASALAAAAHLVGVARPE